LSDAGVDGWDALVACTREHQGYGKASSHCMIGIDVSAGNTDMTSMSIISSARAHRGRDQIAGHKYRHPTRTAPPCLADMPTCQRQRICDSDLRWDKQGGALWLERCLRDLHAIPAPLCNTLRDRPCDNLDILGRQLVRKIPRTCDLASACKVSFQKRRQLDR